MLRDTALPLNPASLQPGGLRYSLGSANQSNRIKGDNSGGERSLQRQLGMGPKRIYLLSLSPEREKILARRTGLSLPKAQSERGQPPLLPERVKQESERCLPGQRTREEEFKPRKIRDF